MVMSQSDVHPHPTLNRAHFSGNGAMVITTAARLVMAKNSHRLSKSPRHQDTDPDDKVDTARDLTKADLHAMRCVMDGLKLIHRDRPHIKDVLSMCVTEEHYGPHQNVAKKEHEADLSCHFIVAGSVVVHYEVDRDAHGNVFQDGDTDHTNENEEKSEIVYHHGPGEYLAMLSPDGVQEDCAPPPSKVYTLEPTDFIRIDKGEFQSRLERMERKLRQEIKTVVQNPRCVLSSIPEEALDKVLPHIIRQEYPVQHAVIKQGEESAVMYCVAKGRCNLTMSTLIPEARRKACFHVGTVEQYGCFGQECLLESSPSLCTVTTTSHTTVLAINRSALEVVIKEHFYNILEKNFTGYPSEEELREFGYNACLWNEFKHSQVKKHLVEAGANKLLIPRKEEEVRHRLLPKEQRYQENLRRFIVNGAGFDRVTTRIGSACTGRPKRPQTGVAVRTGNAQSPRHKKQNNGFLNRRVQSAGTNRKSSGPGVTSAKSLVSTTSHCVVSKNDSASGMDHKFRSADGKTFALRNNSQNNKVNEQNKNKGVLVNRCQLSGTSSDAQDQRLIKKTPEGAHGREPEKNSNYLKAVVMVTMKIKDIVKKAKAEVEKSGSTSADGSSHDDDDNKVWYTSIHAERDRLARNIAADKEKILQIREYFESENKQEPRLFDNIDNLKDRSDDDFSGDAESYHNKHGHHFLSDRDERSLTNHNMRDSIGSEKDNLIHNPTNDKNACDLFDLEQDETFTTKQDAVSKLDSEINYSASPNKEKIKEATCQQKMMALDVRRTSLGNPASSNSNLINRISQSESQPRRSSLLHNDKPADVFPSPILKNRDTVKRSVRFSNDADTIINHPSKRHSGGRRIYLRPTSAPPLLPLKNRVKKTANQHVTVNEL